MPDSVLTIVHQASSVTGRVGAVLRERGYLLDRRCPCAGDALPQSPEAYAAVVIFGGPMSANDRHIDGIRAELELVDRVLRAGVPYLGLCLGGQMLAVALGGTVGPHPQGHGEFGFTEIHPTAEGRSWFRDSTWFYQAHREGFETPSCATLLATGDMFAHQAFVYGDHAFATQFHPEITREMIDRWTMYGAHRVGQPGVQPRRAHVAGWELFHAGIERWIGSVLDRFALYGPDQMAAAAD